MEYTEMEFSFLENPTIKNETDFHHLSRCIDTKNFDWTFEQHCGSGFDGIYLTLKTLKENNLLKQDKKFCDVGIGTGTVLAMFASLGYKTYGVDKDSQAIKHAPYFFDRVQEKFGEFRYKPQLLEKKIVKESGDSTFSDGVKLNEMDFYYIYLNDESTTPPLIVEMISPKKGSIIIHTPLGFATPEEYKKTAEENPHLYPDGINFPTYKGLGFKLLNDSEQDMEVYKEDFSGWMKNKATPLFIKE